MPEVFIKYIIREAYRIRYSTANTIDKIDISSLNCHLVIMLVTVEVRREHCAVVLKWLYLSSPSVSIQLYMHLCELFPTLDYTKHSFYTYIIAYIVVVLSVQMLKY